MSVRYGLAGPGVVHGTGGFPPHGVGLDPQPLAPTGTVVSVPRDDVPGLEPPPRDPPSDQLNEDAVVLVQYKLNCLTLTWPALPALPSCFNPQNLLTPQGCALVMGLVGGGTMAAVVATMPHLDPGAKVAVTVVATLFAAAGGCATGTVCQAAR